MQLECLLDFITVLLRVCLNELKLYKKHLSANFHEINVNT